MTWESDSDGTWRLIDADGDIQATVWNNGAGAFTVEYSRAWASKVCYSLLDAKRCAVDTLVAWHQRTVDELKALRGA